MSVRRSSADVEWLLRRTYVEVAERTTVAPAAPSGEVRLSPIVAPSRPPARTLLASAAALVLIVGGLLVLVNRGDERPAGLAAPTHVLPGQVPHAEVGDGSGDRRALALTAVQTDNQRDRITYSSTAASITVELDRTRRSLPDGEPSVVRGEPARRTDSTLSWLGPDDAVVEVSWSGEVDEATIDTFAQAILYVDDEIWSEATSTGGFRRRSGSEPLATVRIEADVPFDVDLVGDLHQGLSLQVGPNGYSMGPVVPCRPSTNFETSDPESRVIGYVILARGDAASAVVRAPGADDRSIDLTSLLPLVDMSIGGVVYEDRAPGTPDPRVDCEGAS